MSAKVYTWLPASPPNGTTEAKGHASLELSDGTYISWIYNAHPGTSDGDVWQQSFRSDVEREERKPDKTFLIRNGKIDEEVIRSWWRRWWREEIWRKQMPVVPIYTVFEALTIGQKGFDMSGEKAIYMTNKLLIDYIRNNKLTGSGRKCVIL